MIVGFKASVNVNALHLRLYKDDHVDFVVTRGRGSYWQEWYFRDALVMTKKFVSFF